MSQEAKRLWLEALRSGEYTQGMYILTSKYKDSARKHCCLGVLCEISQLPTELWRGRKSLPPAVLSWAGLEPNDSFVKLPGNLSLASLNDSGKSFSEIADLIEAEL